MLSVAEQVERTLGHVTEPQNHHFEALPSSFHLSILCVCVCVCVYTHTHTHIYTHTHMYIYIFGLKFDGYYFQIFADSG